MWIGVKSSTIQRVTWHNVGLEFHSRDPRRGGFYPNAPSLSCHAAFICISAAPVWEVKLPGGEPVKRKPAEPRQMSTRLHTAVQRTWQGENRLSFLYIFPSWPFCIWGHRCRVTKHVSGFYLLSRGTWNLAAACSKTKRKGKDYSDFTRKRCLSTGRRVACCLTQFVIRLQIEGWRDRCVFCVWLTGFSERDAQWRTALSVCPSVLYSDWLCQSKADVCLLRIV